jgi:hypothetical protein
MQIEHLRMPNRRDEAMTVNWSTTARYLVVLAALASAACSTQRATFVPDGRRGFVVSCGGMMNTYARCLTEAGLACGSSGYEIVDGGPYDRILLVACHDPGSAKL